VGVLGIDVSVHDGRYRIDTIVRNAHFSHLSPLLNPPLDGPGVDVREGDFVLAIDGEEVTAERNLYSYLEGKRNRPVEITVAATPDGGDPRTVTVVPRAGFGSLRQQSWAEAAENRVQELSRGRLGYVYVDGWGGSGLDDFYRGLLGHSDKEGLIVDSRFNGGGTTADFAIEALARSPLYAYAYRYGEPFPVSPVAYPRPKVLLVNRWNFSAGETFPLMWRLAGLGPIVGTRTGGGGIGSALFQRELVDGGAIRIPNRAAFDPAGAWVIENRGLVPDLEVEVTPADELAGRDPQIEAAVRLALEALDSAEPREVVRPEYPVHPKPEP
jgi:tricorn protease